GRETVTAGPGVVAGGLHPRRAVELPARPSRGVAVTVDARARPDAAAGERLAVVDRAERRGEDVAVGSIAQREHRLVARRLLGGVNEGHLVAEDRHVVHALSRGRTDGLRGGADDRSSEVDRPSGRLYA